MQAHNSKDKSEFSEPITFTTKVNVEDIPRPLSVEYNKDLGRVDVIVRPTSIDLVGRVEIKRENYWLDYDETFPIIGDRGRLHLSGPHESVETVRVSLCLANAQFKCGAPEEADGKHLQISQLR